MRCFSGGWLNIQNSTNFGGFGRNTPNPHVSTLECPESRGQAGGVRHQSAAF